MDRRAFVKKWTPSPLTLILLGLVAWLWFRPPAEVSDETHVIPPWQVTLTDNSVLTSDALKGKVVLVNFWATWCPYCRKESPAIDAFWQDYRSRGFDVILISVDDPPDKIDAWMKDKGYTFRTSPISASAAAAFGSVTTVPTSFILDADGHIRHKIVGQVYYGRLEKLVTPLLDTVTNSGHP